MENKIKKVLLLVDALVRRAEAGEVEDLHFHHFHTEGPAPYSDPKYSGIFFEQGFFVGPNVRPNVNSGYADYLPVHLGESQKLYRCGAIKLGAALVQVSTPDENGMVSLGHRRTLHKIQLAAGSGEYPRSDRVCADLACQVHLGG